MRREARKVCVRIDTTLVLVVFERVKVLLIVRSQVLTHGNGKQTQTATSHVRKMSSLGNPFKVL